LRSKKGQWFRSLGERGRGKTAVVRKHRDKSGLAEYRQSPGEVPRFSRLRDKRRKAQASLLYQERKRTHRAVRRIIGAGCAAGGGRGCRYKRRSDQKYKEGNTHTKGATVNSKSQPTRGGGDFLTASKQPPRKGMQRTGNPQPN